MGPASLTGAARTRKARRDCQDDHDSLCVSEASAVIGIATSSRHSRHRVALHFPLGSVIAVRRLAATCTAAHAQAVRSVPGPVSESLNLSA